MDRSTADNMGMLATVINALAVQNALESAGVSTRVRCQLFLCNPFMNLIFDDAHCAIWIKGVLSFLPRALAILSLPPIPLALRASEMDCDCLLKGTKVDGVYDADPVKHRNAKRYDRLTYRQ